VGRPGGDPAGISRTDGAVLPSSAVGQPGCGRSGIVRARGPPAPLPGSATAQGRGLVGGRGNPRSLGPGQGLRHRGRRGPAGRYRSNRQRRRRRRGRQIRRGCPGGQGRYCRRTQRRRVRADPRSARRRLRRLVQYQEHEVGPRAPVHDSDDRARMAAALRLDRRAAGPDADGSRPAVALLDLLHRLLLYPDPVDSLGQPETAPDPG